MTNETIQRLDDLFSKLPILVGGAGTLQEVNAAELAIGRRFDSDYTEFLLQYGGAMVGSQPIFGVRQAEVMGDEDSVALVTLRFRKDRWNGVQDWVVISVDLAGNPCGLNEEGEVWTFDHDAGALRRVAASFEEFVTQLLDRVGTV